MSHVNPEGSPAHNQVVAPKSDLPVELQLHLALGMAVEDSALLEAGRQRAQEAAERGRTVLPLEAAIGLALRRVQESPALALAAYEACGRPNFTSLFDPRLPDHEEAHRQRRRIARSFIELYAESQPPKQPEEDQGEQS